MMMTTCGRLGLGRGLGAASALFLLGTGMAAAQDAEVEAMAEDVMQRYEEGVAAGDWQAVAALYAEDGLYAPMSGGLIEGRDGIADFYAQSGVTAVDLRSSRTEMIGETVVLLIGTFTVTLAGEGGDMDVEGEYVTVAEVGEDGLQLLSGNIFPLRQAPGAPAQQ
jgi:uncharacterized protein (TIGR02246 family)